MRELGVVWCGRGSVPSLVKENSHQMSSEIFIQEKIYHWSKKIRIKHPQKYFSKKNLPLVKRKFASNILRNISPRKIYHWDFFEFSWASGRVFSWRNMSRDFWFEFSWTSGRVFSWKNISRDFFSNFLGPVVEFFLEDVFLVIFYSNFPGPVVEFFLEEITLGIWYSSFRGPVVEFLLEEIFLGIFSSNFPKNISRDFLFEFSWTSGRVFFLKNYF